VYAQGTRLTFSSWLNCDWHALDSVIVTNMTQGEYSTTLYYPDTVLELIKNVGITDFSSNKSMDLLTYPNPFSGTAQLSFSLLQAGNTTLTLYDLLGKKIVQHSQHLETGQHCFTLESCPKGYYLLHINTPQGSISSKLLCHGNNNFSTPAIHYSGIEELKIEKKRKLYDPDFPFNLNNYFYIRGYYKGEFLEYYKKVSQDVEYTFSFFDSSILVLSPMLDVFSSPTKLFNSNCQNDTLYIVNNFDTLSLLLGDKIDEAPIIDFSTQSVILIQGTAPHQPADVRNSFGKNSFDQYMLKIKVIEGAATAPGPWHVGFITEKIPNGADICLLIYYCDLIDNCRMERINID
jgi:hypothetical protein